MPRRRERRWPKTAAAYCVFLLLLAGITAFAYETAAPASLRASRRRTGERLRGPQGRDPASRPRLPGAGAVQRFEPPQLLLGMHVRMRHE